MSLQTLVKIWDDYTAPHPSIQDIQQQRQSRLVASFSLLILIVGLIGTFQSILFKDPLSRTIYDLVIMSIVTTAYLLNRRAQYVAAARTFVLGLFIYLHVSLITENHVSIYFVVVLILLSGILLSPQATFGIFMASVALQFTVATFAPISFTVYSVQPLDYTVLSSLLILVFLRYRSSLERERQAELRKTIDALRKSEARWRSLVENAPDFIFELDKDYRVRYINRTQAAIGAEQIVGKSIFEFVPAKDHDRIRELIQSVIQTRKTAAFEGIGYNTVRETSGWYSTLISPISHEGDLDGMMLMIRDVSERVRAEQQRLELSLSQDRIRLLRDLIGDLSHDLKTPLTIIKTSLYLLENLVDPQKQRDKLENIKQQAVRLGKIIEDILTLSTLDKDPQLSMKSLNLNQLAVEIEKHLRPVADSKGITFKLDLCRDFAAVLGDEEALRRALFNLVENALNYTPAPGEVLLRIDQRDHRIIVEVQDTGIGISTDDIPHIFDRFYRSAKVRRSRTRGTGLGLAIVKKTIEMHQGDNEVTSKLGGGTTFQISLPSNN